MKAERETTVPNVLGLHVRPSAVLAETATKYKSKVEIVKDGRTVNVKSSLDLLTLAAVQGSILTVRANGPDAEEAVAEVVGLIESGFGED